MATAAPAFALSSDAIVITDAGSARTSDEAGNVPAASTYLANAKFNVTLPAGTSLTGTHRDFVALGWAPNGLQHKGATTTPANASGNRGAFVRAGLYSNETSGLVLSAPAPDTGGSAAEPAYAAWTYSIPDALLVAGTTVPLQFTYKGLGRG